MVRLTWKPTESIFVFVVVLLLTPVLSLASPPDDTPAFAAGRATSEAASPQKLVLSEESTGLGTLFRDLARDVKHMPSLDSLTIGLIGGGLALAAHPFDSEVNPKLANDGGFFKIGDSIGPAAMLGASTAVYVVGRATGQGRVAHVGLDLLRAEIIGEGMVQALKVSVQRSRPDGSSGYSFPSGHAAAAFAAATVVDRHHGFLWALPTYALATYVGTSRLHDNVHNLSDVVFGAAVGTIAGRTVTRHGRSNFALVPVALPGGAALLFARTPTPPT